jgi:tetratricopeptide (TPR) repeat protein
MLPEIEKLIDLALADGQITEKERNVILKKAIALGIDEDEIEMIVEAKIHKFHSSKKENSSDKIENIKKCPSCGNVISGLSKTCLCGYVINSGEIKNSKSLEEAIETLENLIVEIRSLKENPNKLLEERISAKIEKEIRYINVRYSDNLIVKKLITELEELSNSAIFTIKKKRQRKKIISSTLILISVIIIGFVIFKKVTYKTPEQKFKIAVNALYKDKIIAYKKTADYKKDSIYFYQLYNDVLKNALASQKHGEKLDERWENLNIVPPSAFKYYFLARKFRRNGDINNSKIYSDTCIALYPKFASLYFNLSAFDSDKWDVRLENLNKAIELDKDKTKYLFQRSCLFYENNDFQKAYDDIRKFNVANKNNFNSNLFEISILIDLNMRDNACEKYLKLKNQFVKEFEIYKIENPSVISMIEKKCK